MDFNTSFSLPIESTKKVFKFLVENCKCTDIWNIKEVEDESKNRLRRELIEIIDMFTTVSRKKGTENEQ